MLARIRLAWLTWVGTLANLAGYPCVIREGRYDSPAHGVGVRVWASNLYTVVSVNGIDVYFYRLTGGIDGIADRSDAMADISYYLSLPYTKVLKRDEDGDVVATIAELDGCITHGSDDAEALRNLEEAQAAWLEAALAAKQNIPLPQQDEELPSGKFVVRMPRSLHRKLNQLAMKDDVSLNQLLVMAATEHVTRREAPEPSKLVDFNAWRDSAHP